MVELELITDPDTLLMVEEGIRGGMCHAIHRYAKVNNRYIKNHGEDEESSYIQDSDASNLYGWNLSQKLPVGGFEWTEDVSKIEEYYIKNYDEDGDIDYVCNVDIEYPKELHNLRSN